MSSPYSLMGMLNIINTTGANDHFRCFIPKAPKNPSPGLSDKKWKTRKKKLKASRKSRKANR